MTLIPDYIFPLGYYLIPFTGVVGIVIAVMCAILVSGVAPLGKGGQGGKAFPWTVVFLSFRCATGLTIFELQGRGADRQREREREDSFRPSFFLNLKSTTSEQPKEGLPSPASGATQ